MKRRFKQFCYLILTGSILSMNSACTDKAQEEIDNTDYDLIERTVFDGWMEINYPNLVNNRQSEGYYIEILEEPSTQSDAAAPGCWIKYNVTTRDLQDNVYYTRNEFEACQQGVFNYYAHYAPATDYIPELSDDEYDEDIDDAIELALTASTLVIDGVKTDVSFMAGMKFRIYTPSEYSRIANGSVNGSGGYGGQYVLSGYRPVKIDIEITDVILDTESFEQEQIDMFISQNSNYNWETLFTDEMDEDNAGYIVVSRDYVPSEVSTLNFVNPYQYERLIHSSQSDEPQSLDELQLAINTELIDRHGYGLDNDDDWDVIGVDNSVYIWYIVRTLDGFILDTNIEEIQELIYKTTTTNIYSVGYEAESNETDYISSWYYVIQELCY